MFISGVERDAIRFDILPSATDVARVLIQAVTEPYVVEKINAL